MSAREANPFECWYEPGGTGSGVGSHLAYCEGYVRFLEQFMQRHKIRTVVDWGCGDWQFSRHVRWGDVAYCGVDVVPALIDKLTSEHPQHTFELASDPWIDHMVVTADLVICKDVCMHLPDAEVRRLLKRFSLARHLLITNNRQTRGPNVDGDLGGYRALDLRLPPFNVAGREVYTFPPDLYNYGPAPGWEKVVLHVERGAREQG